MRREAGLQGSLRHRLETGLEHRARTCTFLLPKQVDYLLSQSELAGALGLEPRPAQSKCAVLPLHYAPILVLLAGNDPTSRPYQERVLPLYYRSLVAMEGFEPPIFRV